VPHLEQELLTLPEHLSLPQVFGGVRVARSLVFCLVFCISLFDLFLFSFFFISQAPNIANMIDYRKSISLQITQSQKIDEINKSL
jgi:hypothetical protein